MPKQEKNKRKAQQNDSNFGPPTEAIVFQRQSKSVQQLPRVVQNALAGFKTTERAGFAPVWEHDTEGDFIIGRIESERNAGQYETKIITLNVRGIGNVKTGAFSPTEEFLAVWVTMDLATKLNAEELGLIDRKVIIQFDGWLTKEDNPRLKNDMKLYTVIDIEEDGA